MKIRPLEKLRSSTTLKRFTLLLFVSFIGASCNSQLQSSKVEEADEATTSTKKDRPNIVVILADDLGYSDLGCYGGEINTPNLDKLAANGMRFTQFYNTSRCCPTRASLLTGLYSHQAGIGRMTMDTGKPGYRGFLKVNTVTVAEVLKQAGYNTGMVGKWHVSETPSLEHDKQLKWLAHQENYGPFSDTASYPTARGFDKYYGNIWGVVDYFDPFSLVNGKEQVMEVPEDYYHTDAISDSAVAYVDQFAKQDEPFFLYVAHCAPHWPLQARPEDIAKYKDKYKDGWQALRKARYKRQLELGLFDEEHAELPEWMFKDKNWETDPDQEWDANAMAVHAAMVDRMDQGIGKLIAKLEESGEMDNTLILFMSDNGASYERSSQYGPGFDRAGSTRDGKEVYFPVKKKHLSGPQTVNSAIGPQWAHSVNVPFRYWKSKVFEGGICTPMIAYWPDVIKDKNSINKEVGHVVDIMATCVDLAETQYPTTYKGKEITPEQGHSLVPIFKTGERPDPEFVFWEHFGSKAIRQGDWKLVQLDDNSPWQLYNLAEDRTELHNLADQHPDRVKAMEATWKEKADDYDVYPRP
ncbi:arylsulfatase [Fulvivirga ligni]|uniref:arylsulfatase n=1 Tax=Fulvivirga ligni TaxID=2904246 RepID=UPI001F1B0356|nr:arylsulfatase [Fulvivirga ligni]UII20065.1 arylsulfatase [Fulvivirga ligni]